jgi:protein OS-9
MRFSQWEAYDLGRAPEPGSGADLSMADHNALAANLELARGAGSRYLVQRWGDGTLCDKTGKRREIEVQVSASHLRALFDSSMRISVHVARPSSTAP